MIKKFEYKKGSLYLFLPVIEKGVLLVKNYYFRQRLIKKFNNIINRSNVIYRLCMYHQKSKNHFVFRFKNIKIMTFKLYNKHKNKGEDFLLFNNFGEVEFKKFTYEKYKKPIHENKNAFIKGSDYELEQLRFLLPEKKASLKTGKRMSSYEEIIFKFINLNNLQYIFSGRGKYRIENKMPDFIDVKNKRIIEVYCEFFKLYFGGYKDIEDYKRDRKKIFNKHGYKILFLNDKDIETEDYKNKIINF